MRLVPLSLEIQAFRSFYTRQTFQFPEKAGIGRVCGGNGAGKSSLWSALFWCLYGKSERKLSTNDLHSWNSNEKLEVKFNFLLDGQISYIQRNAKPISRVVLKIGNSEGRVVSDEELCVWLGMGPDIFLFGVMTPQFGESFLELASPEKQSFLMSLMHMEKWDNYINYSSRKASEIDIKLLELKQQIIGMENSRNFLQKEYEEHSNYSKNWEAEIKARLESLQQSKIGIQAAIATAESIVKRLEETPPDDLNDLQEQLKLMKEERESIQKEIDMSNLSIGSWQAKATSLKATQNKYNNLAASGYLCPTCGQPTDAAHIFEENQKITLELQTAQKELESVAKEKEKNSSILRQLAVKQLTLESKIKEVERTSMSRIRQIDAQKNEIKTYRVKITHLEQQQADISNEKNIHQDLANRKLEELRAVAESIATSTTLSRSLATKGAIYEFWKKGFKEIQLFLLNEVTTQLEMSYNSSLASLGMNDWKLKVAVENETKSGTIQNKFTISVISPQKSEPVPVKSWCGGETQRLRLACTLGTFDLIRQLSPIMWDLEIWDEPGQHLSEEGYNSLFQILKQRSQILGKQIFITDHNALQNEQFDFIRNITRTPEGSIIQNAT